MKPQELPTGQINPAAQGVDAFLNPVDYQVQRPGQPASLSGVKGVSTVQTAGVGSIQGRNSAQDLASALSQFAPALGSALSTGAVAYAGWQMDEGEKKALNAAQLAAVNNDQLLEAAANEYAAGNRALATKDPGAARVMNEMNPFQRMGFQRGISKALAAKIKQELPQVALGLSPDVYLSPDMGASALEKAKATRLNQLMQQYGYSSADPGFQTNVLPAINKASDDAYSTLAKDRAKWFDENAPRIQANAIGQMIQTAQATGQVEVEINGQTLAYSRADDPESFKKALMWKAGQLNNEFGLRAGLPGQRSKWDLETYKILMAQADFAQNPELRQLVDNIPSTVPMRDAKGNVMKYPATGQVKMLPMGNAYSQDSIDSTIKYGKAAWEMQQVQYNQSRVSAETFISDQISGMPPGRARTEAAFAALSQWAAQTKADATTVSRLRRELPSLMETEAQLYGQQFEPDAGLIWEQDFDRREANGEVGSKGDELNRLNAAVERMGPAGNAFYRSAKSKIDQAFEGKELMDSFPNVRNQITAKIKQNISTYYPYGLDKASMAASEYRQQLAFEKLIEDRLVQFRTDKGRDPTAAEAKEIAARAMNEYGQNSEQDKDRRYLYPGSKYPNAEPSVDPAKRRSQGAQQPPVSQQTNAPSTAARASASAPASRAQNTAAKPVYMVHELDGMPNRRARALAYETEAVIDLASLRHVVFNLVKNPNYQVPAPLRRLMNEARVADPFVFLDAQLRQYPNYKWDWSTEEYQRMKRRLQATTSLMSNSIATASLEGRGLGRLARLNDWYRVT